MKEINKKSALTRTQRGKPRTRIQWSSDLRNHRRVLKPVEFDRYGLMPDITLWLLDVHINFDIGSHQVIRDWGCRGFEWNAIAIDATAVATEAVELDVWMSFGAVVTVGERVVHYTCDCHSDLRDFAGGKVR